MGPGGDPLRAGELGLVQHVPKLGLAHQHHGQSFSRSVSRFEEPELFQHVRLEALGLVDEDHDLQAERPRFR
jgi:hypothetical protein